jgi:hypothetical protein
VAGPPFFSGHEWAALHPASTGWIRHARVESAYLVLIGINWHLPVTTTHRDAPMRDIQRMFGSRWTRRVSSRLASIY